MTAQDQPLSAALLARAERLDGDAIALASTPALDADSIHAIRLASKELRALWQLLRKALPGPAAEASTALAAAAATLSATRDSQVLAPTLQRQIRQSRRQTERHILENAFACLALDDEPVTTAVPAGLAAAFNDDRQRWAANAEHIRGSALIDEGLRRSWRKTRERLLDAMDADKVSLWHDARTRVKYLFFQSQLLADAGLRSPLDPGALKRLSRDLGRLHDLHLLIGAVDARRGQFASADDAGFCLHVLRHREAALQAACSRDASHLTQVKPAQLVRTLGRQAQQ